MKSEEVDMAEVNINPKSIWNEDNYEDFISFHDIKELSKFNENILEDFYYLLNNSYLDQDGRKYDYKPNSKWVEKYLCDIVYED